MAGPGTMWAGEAAPSDADLPPGEPPRRPRSGPLAVLAPSLAVASLGVFLVLLGLAWDALAHAAHPDRHEEVFTLANPAHLCLTVGVAATAVGVIAATWRVLKEGSPFGRTAHRYLVVMGATVALAVSSLAWVARHEPGEAVGPGGAALMDDHGSAEGCRASEDDRRAAARLLEDTRAGAARFQSAVVAAAEGYRSAFPTPLPTDHYVNFAYSTDGKVLDPLHPEALMYTLTSHGPVLVGVMYLTNKSGEPGPDVGGCLTPWHVHDNLCYAPDTMAISGFTSAPGQCPDGLVHLVPPAALHVWFYDVPGGPFAAEMDPAYLAHRLGP